MEMIPKDYKYRDGKLCLALTNQTSKGRILIFDSLTFRPGVFNEQQKTVTKKYFDANNYNSQ